MGSSLTDRSWIGIDIGTSSVKVLVLDGGGRVLGRGHSSYSSSLANGMSEQVPGDYLEAVARAVAQCGEPAHTVDAVGIVGQTPTCVLIDAAGVAVRPALTWQDARAREEAEELDDRFGDATALVGVALPWTASYPPAKLLWIHRNEPQTVAATRWVLQPKDYVGFAMTGEAGGDRWSSKGLVNVLDGQPIHELLEATGWGSGVVAPVSDPWAVLGTLREDAARTFGLPAGIPVTVGWSDALAGMLAVGALERPTAFILSGTSDIVGVSEADGDLAAPGLFAIPASCAPLPILYGPTQSSGASLTWLADTTGRSPAELVELAAAASDDDPPTFVPYLSGERAPIWRPQARGAFHGLSADHRLGDLARAVMVGVGMTARHVLDVAEESGAEIDEVVIAGRSAREPGWIDARLASLGKPLRLIQEPDTSSLGAAMLAAMADGRALADLSGLRGEVVVVEPSAGQRTQAAVAYARFREASRLALEWESAPVEAAAP